MLHFQYKKKFRLNHCVKVMNIYTPSIDSTMVNFTKRQNKLLFGRPIGTFKELELWPFLHRYKPIT